MKKQMLTAVIALSTLAPLVSVSADEVPAENREGKTEVSASFTGNKTDNVTPVDPDDNTKPIDDGDKDDNGAKGGTGLSLIYVPKTWSFGSNNVPSMLKHFQLQKEGSSLVNGGAVVEVSDARGTNAGWTLKVGSEQLKGSDGSEAKGVSLSLPSTTLTTPSGVSNGAISYEVENALGAATPVMSAEKENGGGITVSKMSPQDIYLNVPGNAVKAQAYSATLNWTLEGTPIN